MTDKKCHSCLETKDVSEFHRSKGTKDGAQARCKICRKFFDSQRYLRDKDILKAKTKQWGIDNPDKIRKIARRTHLRKSYGITPEEYDDLLEQQGGGCAICGITEDPHFKTLSVDHCHETNRVRAILCNRCNRGIGLFGDSADCLEAAARYLRRTT